MERDAGIKFLDIVSEAQVRCYIKGERKAAYVSVGTGWTRDREQEADTLVEGVTERHQDGRERDNSIRLDKVGCS